MGEAIEIGQAIGDEGEDASRTEGIVRLNGVECFGKRLLIALARCAPEFRRCIEREHRAEMELNAVDGLDRSDEIADVELDVGQAAPSSLRYPFGQEGQRIQGAERRRGGKAQRADLQDAAPTERSLLWLGHDLVRGSGLPGLGFHANSFADASAVWPSTAKDGAYRRTGLACLSGSQ